MEAALAEHPSVAEVACAEVKVRADVSVIAAFVVAHAGTSHDAADIERFAAERLAAYKRPRCIVFVEALPRTANGKLMRQRAAPSRRIFHRLTLWHPRRGAGFSSAALHTS